METENRPKSYLPKAGLYLGIIGTVSLLFFTLIYSEDWTHRYTWLWCAVPMPVIFLIIARKYQFVGGLLLIILGIAIFIFDVFAYPGTPGQIAGKGQGYTIGFVSLPLIISGCSFILHRWKYRKSAKKSGKQSFYPETY
jgi:hypothetical protein